MCLLVPVRARAQQPMRVHTYIAGSRRPLSAPSRGVLPYYYFAKWRRERDMSPSTESKARIVFVNKHSTYGNPHRCPSFVLPYPHTRPCSPSLSFWTRRVLKSLFPSWLPAQFAVMFSKPFPAFSSRLNAWVTVIASQWLMGPSQLNDIEVKKTSR